MKIFFVVFILASLLLVELVSAANTNYGCGGAFFCGAGKLFGVCPPKAELITCPAGACDPPVAGRFENWICPDQWGGILGFCVCTGGTCSAECSDGFQEDCGVCSGWNWCAKTRICTDQCVKSCEQYQPCNCVVGKCSVECCVDADCASKDNRIGKCCSPGGTACSSGYDYKCKWGPCTYNSDCDSGYCCEKAAYSGAAITIRPLNGCVGRGTIKNNKYLCDPPEWSSTESSAQKFNIFDSAFSYFKNLFG